MTLLVFSRSDAELVLLSDAMVMGSNASSVVLPTTVGTRLESSTPKASFFQKIMRVTEDRYFAWCGCMDEAKKLFEVLQDNKAELADQSSSDKLLKDFGYDSNENIQYVFLEISESQSFFILGGWYKYRLYHGLDYYVLGTGADAYVEWLDRHANSQSETPNFFTATNAALAFCADAYTAQARTGLGLDRGWGAAFEIVVAEGRSLRKLPSLYVASFLSKSVDGRVRYKALWRSVQWSNGETTYVAPIVGNDMPGVFVLEYFYGVNYPPFDRFGCEYGVVSIKESASSQRHIIWLTKSEESPVKVEYSSRGLSISEDISCILGGPYDNRIHD